MNLIDTLEAKEAGHEVVNLDGFLFFDLEVHPDGKLLKVGAVLNGRKFERAGSFSIKSVLSELSEFSREAQAIVGHNILQHDLPILNREAFGNPFGRLPVIDTLLLSPICFPQNPYHSLIKDRYKLVSRSVNDPVADAMLASELLRDEILALESLATAEPELFRVLHFLLTAKEGDVSGSAAGNELLFRRFFGAKPTFDEALALTKPLLGRWGCLSVPMSSWLFEPEVRIGFAFTLAWLRVAGANSVLPPWVRKQYPIVQRLVRGFRETPCASRECSYCREEHDPEKKLKSFFDYDQFRSIPPNKEGGSLQRDIVQAGMRNRSLLAILPTGGGKSICFQLPALVRNLQNGSLTIVISPLQSLMKDQVDGLARRTRTPFAAALYGLLTMPERSDVLRRVRMGDVAILYVSPEQLRNRSFSEAISQREISCWVFDEAHCLSKWGHDFRPDYLYAARFIREFSASQGVSMPAIACFTATAKQDVKEEILSYLKSETGLDLQLFEGGVERKNLRYEVQAITVPEKLERVHELLSEQFSLSPSGTAIVFRSTRKNSELTAEFLKKKGWEVAHFHAGLTPSEKKDIQDKFLSGGTKVICATNAFGMGIDKEDVRLVIHGDTPGSLENYLQEAGRAGRDQKFARCVLLYSDSDIEWQFRMSSMTELTKRDIAQILKTLRKARRGRDELVITPAEVLRDEHFESDLDPDEHTAETKVRTAVSWLEKAQFLTRDENVTNVFQASVRVRSIDEARTKMGNLNLSRNEQALWTAILLQMINTPPDQSLTVDRLALLPELCSFVDEAAKANSQTQGFRPHDYVSGKIFKVLRSMAEGGILKRDTLLSAFVHYKVRNASNVRLERTIKAEAHLLELLSDLEPSSEDWMQLSVPRINQQLESESVEISPEMVRLLLKSLREDGAGFAGRCGSIELRYLSRDTYRLKLNRSWKQIIELSEKRRKVASLILQTLFTKVPPGKNPSSDILVSFSFEDLGKAIEEDLLLRSELTDIDCALERALMYLHEQQIITLQNGLAVFRSAMTIRFKPAFHSEKYVPAHFEPLAHYYKERIFQIHVMGEYARRSMSDRVEGFSLIQDYFDLPKEEFVRRYFAGKKKLLSHATTAQAFQEIVTNLANPAQMKIVTAPVQSNMLILAGPGSGKSKTVIHRCAYLLRVERVRPQSVLVCCFNRQTVVELRKRLEQLVGNDAKGVTIATYHSLAMRLLGFSFSGSKDPETAASELDSVIPRATAHLRGEKTLPGIEADEARDRLLAGFQHILVDEYQDIDADQYDFISALAGRTLNDPDAKLSILAVGDDDQNIYSFRGANVQFIRRFQSDYEAEIHYLVENYRSTKNIIAASNRLIAENTDRMKAEHPIRINALRSTEAPGGSFSLKDPLTGGRVRLLELPSGSQQGSTAVGELKRLKALGVTDWSSMAVLGRTHADIAQVRAVAEEEGIPVRWLPDRERMPRLHHIREIHDYLGWLDGRVNRLGKASELIRESRSFLQLDTNPWVRFLTRVLDDWKTESSDAELPIHEAYEFLWSCCLEARTSVSHGDGVTLSTVHAAKGTEYDHVILTGTWPNKTTKDSPEELRRLLYVGMTRARKTLTFINSTTSSGSLTDQLQCAEVLRETVDVEKNSNSGSIRYALLGPKELDLGYTGRYPADSEIHDALSRLSVGERVVFKQVGEKVALTNSAGVSLGCLSQSAAEQWGRGLSRICGAKVFAVIKRRADQDQDEERRSRYRVPQWEVPLVEVKISF